MQELINRLKKNYLKRLLLVKKLELEAFRLFDLDLPNYPYIVDLYLDTAIIFEKGTKKAEDSLRSLHLEELKKAITEVTKIENFVVKVRHAQGKENQYKKLGRSRQMMTVREGPLKFLVNLHDYLDTGLFLDHRLLRTELYKNAKNKSVLNLFCYTASLSVAAAMGGAIMVTSVDLSKTYLDWALKNFELNGLPGHAHKFINADCMDYLKHLHEERRLFDIVILDPPTFSNSKKLEEDFDLQKIHPELIRLCMKVLSPQGILYFSTNFKRFSLDENLKNEFRFTNTSLKSIPFDFERKNIHFSYKVTHHVEHQ